MTTPDSAAMLSKLGHLAREKVFAEDLTILIDRPDRSDKLLDHPEVNEATRADGYMPYWAEIWPAARMLAKVLAKETFEPGTTALELGCGLGLSGIVALARGAEVVFSDYDACALKFAGDNALLNGFDRFRLLQLDWRTPPADLRVPLIIGADLIYQERNLEPVIQCIRTMLLPGGRCLLADQDRVPAAVIQAALSAAGMTFTTQVVKASEPGSKRLKGTLYRIRG